jgi:hypothetical protein
MMVTTPELNEKIAGENSLFSRSCARDLRAKHLQEVWMTAISAAPGNNFLNVIFKVNIEKYPPNHPFTKLHPSIGLI